MKKWHLVKTVSMLQFQNLEKKIFGVQFHPEVVHTFAGHKIIRNFVRNICNCKADWNMKLFKNKILTEIKNKVGDNKVICGLSGGAIQQ